MDLYIDQNRRVWLLDLAPFAEGTDPLLFSWEELEDVLLDGEVPLRCVLCSGRDETDSQGSNSQPLTRGHCSVKCTGW